MKRNYKTYMIETSDGNMLFVQSYNKDNIKAYFKNAKCEKYTLDDIVTIDRIHIHNIYDMMCDDMKNA